MKLNKIFYITLVLVLSCSIIVAKNESEKIENESKNINSSILNKVVNSSEIFTEGGSSNPTKLEVESAEEPKKSKVKGRKGVSFEDLKTSSDDEQHPANSSIVLGTAVQTNNSSTSSVSSSTTTTTTSLSDQSKTNETLKNIPSTKSVPTSTVRTVTKSTTLSSTSINPSTTTTTTKKPIMKPSITYSADDSEAIKESEKNINYNIAKEKSPEDVLPKLEQDIDRAVLEEKKTRKSYMIYLFLAVVVPLTFVAINLAYKRVKTCVELRHYQRVDFLIDGMYAN